MNDPFRDPDDPPCADDRAIDDYVKYVSIETWVV